MEMKFNIDPASGHPLIPVYINGEGPFEFHLDTGGGYTALTTRVAEDLGLEMIDMKDAKAAAIGGLVSIKSAKVDSFRIGTETFEDEGVIVMDFEATSCSSFDGIIGHSMLKHYRMLLDYESMVFRLENSNGRSLKDKIDWMEFRYLRDSHLVGVPVHINGQGPSEFAIDTGSGGNVMTPTMAKELGLDHMPPDGDSGCSEGRCEGVAGVAVGYGTTVDTISIGPAEQTRLVIGVIDLKIVSPKGKVIENGIIGYPFLKDFELIIDYPQERFALIDRRSTHT